MNISVVPPILGAFAAAAASLCAAEPLVDSLERDFRNPPQDARPQTWWHWMNGYVTREGITADLEAMQRIGLAGAQLFNVSDDTANPPGPVQFMTPEWRDMVCFAAQESSRLGLKLSIHNCAGWSSSGGPWIKPEHAMQEVVTSEQTISGPASFDAELPKPPVNFDTYHEIAVLAFPTPREETMRMSEARPRVTTTTGADGHPAIDGAAATWVTLPVPKTKAPQFLQFAFDQPYSARMLALQPGPGMEGASGEIQISDDGQSFRSVQAFSLPNGVGAQMIAFPAAMARFYRVAFTAVHPRTKQVAIAEAELLPRWGIENLTGKAFYGRQGDCRVPRKVEAPADVVVPRDAVIDLSDRVGASGRLKWNVPDGRWTILRIGYTPNGQVNHPASGTGSGLECDKLSREAVDVHWAGMVAKVMEDMGPLTGPTFNNVLVDSYEIGTQNWTARFREEFQHRRGYDLTKLLPVFRGFIVDSPDVTERFLWDVRATIADLFAENYAGRLASLAHRNGLQLSVEPYGSCPSDDLQYGGQADIPMAEFWVGQGVDGCTKLAASSGHIYGRRVIGAESFTGGAKGPKWECDPFSLKMHGDGVYCGGINRFIIHTFTHQPWLNRFPGMTMGATGTHFDRTVTWWEQGAAWMQYLSRCQSLLQQGHFSADVCYFAGEDVPGSGYGGNLKLPALPVGYQFDGCNRDVLLHRLAYQDGRLVLPDGMSYRLLVLSSTETMTPEVLRKIRELADAGATIIGPRPRRSPSLAGFPACDAEVNRLATELWDSGKVKSDKTLEPVLSALGLKPDFESKGNSVPMAWIHRVTEGADIYFVSNQAASSESVECTFRVNGRVPELWHPDTGRIEKAPVFREQDGRMTVPLHFDQAGSLFVVFRATTKEGDHLVAARRLDAGALDLVTNDTGRVTLRAWEPGTYEFQTASERTSHVEVRDIPPAVKISGPWALRFPPALGAPEEVTLSELCSWTAHANDGVKYFSGTATYAKEFDISGDLLGPDRQLDLDLGEVKNFAEVILNGVNLGVWWKPPFRMAIDRVARAGRNRLEVRVTNLWVNRLIGDEHLPADCQWTGTRLTRMPQWVLDGKASPTGRVTFTTRHLWTKDDAPLDSGLLGPVILRSAKTQILNP